MTRAFAIALAIAVGATACSSGEKKAPDTALPVTALPSTCKGLGSVPDAGEVTFVKGTLAFGMSPDGEGVRCLTTVSGTNPIFWGPRGDFLIDVGFLSAQVISASERVYIHETGMSPSFHGISRPAGENALFIAADAGSLAKAPTSGDHPQDISFLRRHDEALYHPAGTQLVVIGQSEDGVYGVWVASNEGTDRHPIVLPRGEQDYDGLSFSSDGATLYYTDIDKHISFELRALDLATLEEGGASPKSTLLVKEELPLGAMASPFTEDLLAYRLGKCGEGFKTFVREGSTTREVGADLGETIPIGWLPDDRLVIASSEDHCAQPRALDVHVVTGERSELLVEDVDQVAVRAALPSAPPPVSGPTGAKPE